MPRDTASAYRAVDAIPGVAESRYDQGVIVRALFRKIGKARQDPAAGFEFVMREEASRERIRVLPHQRLVFDFVMAYPRSVIRMPVGFSKCVAAGTEVVDPRTGIPMPVEEAIHAVDRLWTWSKERGIHTAPVTKSHDMGTKETIKIVTRCGRSIVVTPEHPMLTPDGWVEARHIRQGLTLGAPSRVPGPEAPVVMDPDELFLVALLLAEGNVTQAVRFSTADPVTLDRAVAAAGSMGCDVRHIANYDYAINGRGWRCNAVQDMVRRLGFWGCKSTAKRIPPEIYQLPNDQLAQFLAWFWQCDGFVSKGHAAITLANEPLVRQIQHLLLRCGVTSLVSERPARCNGKTFKAWSCRVLSCSIQAFAETVGTHLWGAKAEKLAALVSKRHNPNVGAPRPSPLLTVTLRSLGLGESFSKSGTLSPSRFPEEVERRGLGDQFGWIFGSGVFWDEVISVEPAGVRRVFDFTMEPTACFIAADLVVHNTYTMAYLSMHLLGEDPTTRGAIVSSTQGQAEKPLGLVRDYIERSQELRAVFPHLRPSTRAGDHWTQTKIVVERPAGIRDPSLLAVGVDGALPGSRLNWVLVDDILDVQNTATPAAREKVAKWFATTVLSRRDVRGSKIVVCNTPWVAPSATDDGDLTYVLEKAGWPTLTMNAEGGIFFTNADDFDADYIRPSVRNAWGPQEHRLVDHDSPALVAKAYEGQDPPDPAVDVDDVIPLWPEKFGRAELTQLREDYNPIEFAQLYLMSCQDGSGGKVHVEWINAAKEAGLNLGHYGFKHEWTRPEPTFTGVDLGVGRSANSDFTALFTFAVLEDRRRLILEIVFGRFRGRQIVDQIISAHTRFGSIVRVENNAAQDFILQWTRDRDVSVPLRAHTTGKNKADPRHGVESLFIEIEQGAWIIPSDIGGKAPKAVDQWVQEMVTYRPTAHTGDVLMASWLAREQARISGAFMASAADYSGGILSR